MHVLTQTETLIQVNLAWTFNAAQKQWVDLGFHTEACMTRPETCTTGGAISLWVNIQGSGPQGIISSCAAMTSGFRLFVSNGDIW